MTREEAKKYLMDVSYQLGTMSIEYLSEKDGEKMREAINTLEQEPKIVPIAEIKFDDDMLHEIVEETVKNIEIEPQTGHWIKISPAGIYECSECCQNVMTSDICAYKFCHGCGAKMEVSE